MRGSCCFQNTVRCIISPTPTTRHTNRTLNQPHSTPLTPPLPRYVLLVKIYMSLCQINKSVEVDYYKFRCNGEYRIIIPSNYSKSTSDYFDEITKRYTFSERGGFIEYDEMPLFDVRPLQPEIQLYEVRLDSATAVQSMVKYIKVRGRKSHPPPPPPHTAAPLTTHHPPPTTPLPTIHTIH